LFQNHAGVRLSNHRESATAGTSFDVLEKKLMHYDHRDQVAIKVETTDGERWILAEEAGIPLDA
jgi:hypothetical protein